MGSRFNPTMSEMRGTKIKLLGTKVKLLGRSIDLKCGRRSLDVYNHCRYGERESNMLLAAPAMRNIYRRLLNEKPYDPNDIDRTVPGGKHDRLKVPSAVLYDILGGGHVNCRCYDDSMRTMQRMKHNDDPMSLSKRSMAHLWSNYEHNEDVQLPMSTILVQWNLHISFLNYTQCEIQNIMSCYGDIGAIYKHKHNSALVVFDDIRSACRAMESKQLGYNLTCTWWNKYMLTHCRYSTGKKASVNANRLYSGTAKMNHSTTIIY